jgi:peptide chain release factor 2
VVEKKREEDWKFWRFAVRWRECGAVWTSSGGIFDVEGKSRRIEELNLVMAAPGFWDDQAKAQATVAELKAAKSVVEEFQRVEREVHDAADLFALAEEEGEESTLREVEGQLGDLRTQVDRLELRSFLSGPEDQLGAVVSIHPGAGGTESQDWAEMLHRMYLRWAERTGFETHPLDYQAGDEAGIKDATFEVNGEYAYGYLKSESGVHRLVRISPFDASGRRHTSFASVFVYPQVDESIEVEIQDSELRIDTYRSSGAGGQHVNKTDSAVRITHLPSGIVVTSQNERSQHRNRDNAMKILRARLYLQMLEEERKRLDSLYDQQKEIAWGSQIRSYVFQPYTMVKDHRTDHEETDVQAVMDGRIDGFVDAYLRSGLGKPERPARSERP